MQLKTPASGRVRAIRRRQNGQEIVCAARRCSSDGRPDARPAVPAGFRRSRADCSRPLPRKSAKQDFRCITFSGIGYSGPSARQFENAVNIDWPRIDSMANYTRTINWDARRAKRHSIAQPGLNPAIWKYGLGWVDGTPTQKNPRQTHITNGKLFVGHRRRRPAGRGPARRRRAVSARSLA